MMSCPDKTCIDLPVLDISKPLSLSSLSSLALACKEWGFFQITNHGISRDFYKKLHSLSSTHIFMLPAKVKLKAGPSSTLNTYTPHFIASPFYESLRVAGPDFFTSAQSSSEALINKPNSDFSDMISEYGSKMGDLSRKIIEMLLMCLGAGLKTTLLSEFRHCHGYLRLNNYSLPPAETMKSDDDQEVVEGLGMHTDMSCITIVYQDEVGGLQVRSKEGKWMDIKPCNGNLVVNIGDLMQAWSNGKLRSSEHRVVLRQCSSRFSIAFFWCFQDKKTIFAPSQIVGEDNLRLYRPFICADYLKFRENSEIGKFEKVGYTVQHFAGIK